MSAGTSSQAAQLHSPVLTLNSHLLRFSTPTEWMSLNRSLKNLPRVITSTTSTVVQNLVEIRPRGSSGKIGDCYKNYCIDHNQILHNDRDPQVLSVGGPNMPQINPRWRTAATLKNRKITIYPQCNYRF